MFQLVLEMNCGFLTNLNAHPAELVASRVFFSWPVVTHVRGLRGRVKRDQTYMMKTVQSGKSDTRRESRVSIDYSAETMWVET